MSTTRPVARPGSMRQIWFAGFSIAMIIGIVALAAPGMELRLYLAIAVMMGGAAIAVLGLDGWARRVKSTYVATLSLLQGIGLMVLAFGIANPLDGFLTALAWSLALVAPVLRIRHESRAEAEEP